MTQNASASTSITTPCSKLDVHAVRSGFERAAHRYDLHAHLQAYVRRRVLNLATNFFPECAEILDAGCGTGQLAVEARARGLEWNFTGLDLAHTMCRLSRTQMPAVQATLEALPLCGDYFDGVVSSLALQWTDSARALAECRRVLKPNGMAVVTTLGEHSLHELREAFTAIDELPHVSAFSPLLTGGWNVVQRHTEVVMEYYPCVMPLLLSLRAIGAGNRLQARRRGLTSPRLFQELEQAYKDQYMTPHGLPATWEIVTLVLRK